MGTAEIASTLDKGKLKNAKIDSVYGGKKKVSKWRAFRPRHLAVVLTQRKTWRNLWKAVTSPISPGSWACTLHGLLMVMVTQFELLYLPFAVSFYPHGSIRTVRMGLYLEFLHFLDLVLNLNTSFIRQQKLVTARNEIARDHITKWFILRNWKRSIMAS